MNDKIRVLIADDQAISREGIQRILENESDMAIVGAVETSLEVLPQVRAKAPDVLVLDLKWHGDDEAMYDAIAQLREEHPKTAIVCLTIYEHLIPRAKATGATCAVTKDVSKNEVLGLVRAAYASLYPALGLEELDKAKKALEHLRGLETGEQQYRAYEDDVRFILATVLYPHLTNPRAQAETINRSRRRDILFSNYSSHLFWQHMSQRHDATQIVFEVKNVKELRVRHIQQVAGDLTPGLGRLGFLVSRIPAGEPMSRRAVDVFRDEKKVVLFLCDNDLEEMLQLKERGGEATELIRQRYDDFIAKT
jgi:DNA-binding NarL/FixJ family response regulator